MRAVLLLLVSCAAWAASGLPLDVTDARGKKPGGVAVEAGTPNADGWAALIAKSKGDAAIIWPWDGAVKHPDGPGEIPVVVIVRGDAKAMENPRVVAAIATPVVLGLRQLAAAASAAGFSETAMTEALAGLLKSTDPWAKGVGLLYAGKAEDAADQLAEALRERQRQLTRVPSEIYALAMLHGRAQMSAGRFDAAAVAFLTALKIKPADETARAFRAEALRRAGKADAADAN